MEKIEELVIRTLEECCNNNGINASVDKNTALIGSNRIFDSIGLVNFIIDVENELSENEMEVSLTSENAMSSRISPFRTVGSLCKFIEEQIKNE